VWVAAGYPFFETEISAGSAKIDCWAAPIVFGPRRPHGTPGQVWRTLIE
jgi:hypothetical protein